MNQKTFGHDCRTINLTLQTIDANIESMENSIKQLKKLRTFVGERVDAINEEVYPFLPEKIKEAKGPSHANNH